MANFNTRCRLLNKSILGTSCEIENFVSTQDSRNTCFNKFHRPVNTTFYKIKNNVKEKYFSWRLHGAKQVIYPRVTGVGAKVPDEAVCTLQLPNEATQHSDSTENIWVAYAHILD